MRKKLQDMIKGTDLSGQNQIQFFTKEIWFTVIENIEFSGEFVFSSNNGTKIRGLVTSPSEHIEVKTIRFEGKDIHISFIYRSLGLIDGDEESGYFVIQSNVGEYTLPYKAKISKSHVLTTIGQIKTLSDFSNLAKLNWKEALQLFGSNHMTAVFCQNDKKERNLYRALTRYGFNSQIMEEFLIGCGIKKRVQFSIPESSLKHTFVLSDMELLNAIEVKKNQWGYTHIHIYSDAPFIKLEKNECSTDDFTGHKMEVSYTILPSKVHGGRNYGKIIFSDRYQSVEVEITAFSENFDKNISFPHTKSKIKSKLIQSYIDWKLGRVKDYQWAQVSLELIQSYPETNPFSDWLDLYKSYVYFKVKKPKEGKEALDAFNQKKYKSGDPIESLYLFLTLFTNEEEDYHDLVLSRLRELHRMFPSHPTLAWVLLEADEALQLKERRYTYIHRFLSQFSNSPVYYLEAYLLAHQNPEYVAYTDFATIRILYWITKQGLLTPRYLNAVTQYAYKAKEFSSLGMHIMSEMYRLTDSSDLLKGICMYLMRFHLEGKEFYDWYLKGVQKHLKIVGLNEAYIHSWDASKEDLAPEVIKYFVLQDTLPWNWKAILYAYVLKNRELVGERDYQSYADLIESFAIMSLNKGYTSESLFEIYRFIKETVSTEEWAMMKKDSEEFVAVISPRPFFSYVIYKEKKYPISEGKAYIKYDDESEPVLFQDDNGTQYVNEEPLEIKAILSQSETVITEQEIEKAFGEEIQKREDFLLERLHNFDDTLDRMDGYLMEARNLNLPSGDFEEHFLSRLLFTGRLSEHSDVFFQDLVGFTDVELLLDAYVSLESYEYLIHERKMSPYAVAYIGNALKKDRLLNTYCVASFVKQFYTMDYKGKMDRVFVEFYLRDFIHKGYIFDFFNQIPVSVKREYLIHGFYFVSYHGESGRSFELQITSGHRKPVYHFKEVLPELYVTQIPVCPGQRVQFQVLLNSEKMEEGVISFSHTGNSEIRHSLYGDLVAASQKNKDDIWESLKEEQAMIKQLFPLESEVNGNE